MAVTGLDAVERKLKELAGNGLRFLAEKVESREEFLACREMGFDYFQGFFFAKPALVEGRSLDPNRGTVLEIVSMLASGGEVREVEAAFSRSPELSVSLLRYLNSGCFATGSRIRSIPHAVGMLGREPLCRWLLLFLYAETNGAGKNGALMESALFRAETMARLAGMYRLEKRQADAAYLVGLLSGLDALLQIPAEVLFRELSFDETIEKALLENRGVLGKLLLAARIMERGDGGQVRALLAKMNLAPAAFSDLLAEGWARALERSGA